MTSTFKIGDRVKVVADSRPRNIGLEGTVTFISGHLYLPIEVKLIGVDFEPYGYRRCYHQDELVKIDQEPEEDLYI